MSCLSEMVICVQKVYFFFFLFLILYFLGKLVNGRVLYVVHRRLTEKDSSRDPTHIDKLNLWRCAVCNRADFNDISEVWTHTQKGDCPGIPVGVKVRLDNNLMGFVSAKNISDNSTASSNATQRLLVFFVALYKVLKYNISIFKFLAGA